MFLTPRASSVLLCLALALTLPPGPAAPETPATATLAFSTYFGGAGAEHVFGIADEVVGGLTFVGYTDSSDFPVTAGALVPAFHGNTSRDAGFVSRLDVTGQSLLASTYFGGAESRGADVHDVAVAPDGTTWIAGVACDDHLPTQRPVQATRAGRCDLYVAALSADATTLLFSSYLGGACDDRDARVAIGPAGSAFVAGETCSTNLAATPGALDGGCGTTAACGSLAQDVFVAKLAPAGEGYALAWLTYLGGAGDETLGGIAADSAGRVAVAGSTRSADFPTTADALSRSCAARCLVADGFVSLLSADGAALVHSSFLGGRGRDSVEDVLAEERDGALRLHLGGTTTSVDLPTARPVQAALAPSPGLLLAASASGPFDIPFDAPALEFTAGAAPAALAGADLDGDGKRDLVVADAGGPQLRILRGDGAGGFTAGAPVALAAPPTALAVGDLDADGDADLVTVAGTALATFRNDGAGAFAAGATATLPAAVDDLFVARLDGDARADVLARSANEARVWLTAADGTLPAPATVALGETTAVDLGDRDGDGDLDLFALGPEGGGVVVRAFDNAAGAFAAAPALALKTPAGAAAALPADAHDLAVGDFDGSGRADFALAARGTHDVTVARRVGDAYTLDVHALGWGTLANARPLFAQHLDGDGLADLVQVDGGYLRWGRSQLFGDAATPAEARFHSLWTSDRNVGGDGELAVLLRDFTEDGRADAVVAGPRNADAFVATVERTEAAVGLRFATYLGGSGRESGVDLGAREGVLAIAGTTASADFPVHNATDATLSGPTDAFVTVFDAAGALTLSTYHGGSSFDGANAATVAPGGLVVVGGVTHSTDMVTASYDHTFGGGAKDGFVAALQVPLVVKVPPVVDIADPLADDIFPRFAPVPLEWRAHDPDGGTIVETVVVLDGERVGRFAGAGPGKLELSPARSGWLTVYVYAVDDEGQVGRDAVEFRVADPDVRSGGDPIVPGNDPPVVTIAQAPRVTAGWGDTVPITWTVTDTEDDAITQVEIRWLSVTGNPAGEGSSTRFKLATLPGDARATAIAVDWIGTRTFEVVAEEVVGPQRGADVIQIEGLSPVAAGKDAPSTLPDGTVNTPPTVTITSAPTDLVRGRTYRIEWTSADREGPIVAHFVMMDGRVVAALPGDATAWGFHEAMLGSPSLELAEGEPRWKGEFVYRVEIVAVDAGGLWGRAVASMRDLVDPADTPSVPPRFVEERGNRAPVVTVAPVAGPLREGATASFRWTIVDPDGDRILAQTIAIRPPGTHAQPAPVPPDLRGFSTKLAGPAGAHTVEVAATDTYGATGTGAASFEVEAGDPTTPTEGGEPPDGPDYFPVVTILEPAAGAKLAGRSLPVVFSASDPDGEPILGYRISISVDGGKTFTEQASLGPSAGRHTVSAGFGPATTLVVRVSAWDARGTGSADVAVEIPEAKAPEAVPTPPPPKPTPAAPALAAAAASALAVAALHGRRR